MQTINILLWTYNYSYCVRYSLSKMITCFVGNNVSKKSLNMSLQNH